MVDLGSLTAFGASGSPGVKARCKVTQSTSSSGGGGGLLGAAASLLGGAAESDPWAEHLLRVEITQGPAPSVAVCRLTVARTPRLPALAVGDELSVELGYDQALTPVFTGKLASVADTAERGLVLTLGSSAHLLASLRQNASFEQQSLGDLTRQWAAAAGVTPGSVDAGPSYPFIAIDDHASAWEWIAALARLAGLWAWIDGAGELRLGEPEAAAARSFRYGQDVLALSLAERAAFLGEVSVVGEGAAGSQGADAWSWLVKQADGVKASAGSGGPKRVFQHGALRSHDAADAAARGVSARSEGGRSEVRVTVTGSPELAVASRFELADFPDGRGDGSYVVLGLCHRYDKRFGFRSELRGVAS